MLQIDSSDVDIFCLQEIFDTGIQRQIYAALKNKYPYSLSALNLSAEGESAERACSLEQLQQVGVCAQTQCPNLPPAGGAFAACVALRYSLLACQMYLVMAHWGHLGVSYEGALNLHTCRTSLP